MTTTPLVLDPIKTKHRAMWALGNYDNVASEVVHDPADEVEGSLSLSNAVSTTEWALFLVGLSGLIIWILGCVVLCEALAP